MTEPVKSCATVWLLSQRYVLALATLMLVSAPGYPGERLRVVGGEQSRSANPDVQVAADQLLNLVLPSQRENAYFPPFAKEKLEWIRRQAGAGKLSVLLLENYSDAIRDHEALMSSGIVDGKQAIVIMQPRLKRLLEEEGGVRPPFTQRQKNNFMLGLVHEAVHLTGPSAEGLRRSEDRVREELRAWHEVSLKVVRPLIALNQQMHSQFLRVDAAFRVCGDSEECPLVRPIIFANQGLR